MNYTRDDHRLYLYEMAARDLRRAVAVLHHAQVEPADFTKVVSLLEDVEARLFGLATRDRFDDVKEWDSLAVDLSRYSDGRLIRTVVDWGEGYATVVHHPDPEEEPTRSNQEELQDEMWP